MLKKPPALAPIPNTKELSALVLAEYPIATLLAPLTYELTPIATELGALSDT